MILKFMMKKLRIHRILIFSANSQQDGKLHHCASRSGGGRDTVSYFWHSGFVGCVKNQVRVAEVRRKPVRATEVFDLVYF